MKKTIAAAAAALALLSGTVVAQDAKPLRVATESSYPPFEFFDQETGKAIGFDMDIMQFVADQLGRKLEVNSMGFDAIIPSILTGIADVGASAFTITPERAKRVNFSQPYYLSGLSVLVRAEDKDKIKSVDDLEGKGICVQIGTSGAMRAAKVPGATVRTFNTVAETFIELRNKGCDGVIGDRPVTGYFLASRPQDAPAYYHLPQTLNSEEFGLIVNKSDKKLLDAINEALNKARASGEYARIYKKWFGEEPPKP